MTNISTTIDEGLYKRARIWCVEHDTTFKALLSTAIRAYIEPPIETPTEEGLI